MRTMTVEELQSKLENISKDMLPAIKKGMIDAAQNIEGKAKENCTPGSSPYSKAPHITGTLSRSIASKVEVKGNEVHGIVSAGGEDSPEGPVEYAIHVHEGTSKMPARPFILDAIQAKEKDTTEILTDAIEEALRKHTI